MLVVSRHQHGEPQLVAAPLIRTLFLICKSGALWTQVEITFTVFLAFELLRLCTVTTFATLAVTNFEQGLYDPPKKGNKMLFLLKDS